MIRTLILGGIVAAAVAAAVLGGHGWQMTSMPAVTKVRDLPAGADRAKFEHFLSYGAFLPKARPADPAAPAVMPDLESGGPPMLGYEYRVFSALGLPLTATTESGFVLYREGANGYQVVPMDHGYLDTLEKEVGTRLEAGYVFPFWQFVWGWLFVAALGIWLVLKFRDEARRRRESGVL